MGDIKPVYGEGLAWLISRMEVLDQKIEKLAGILEKCPECRTAAREYQQGKT